MKKFLLSLVVGLGLISQVHAANTSISIANGAVSNVFTAPITVSQFTFANNTATPSEVTFFDSPFNYNTNVTYSFISTKYTAQSVTNWYTNYFGVLNTNIYTALVASSVTNAQTTNLFNVPLDIVVPTNTTILIDGTYKFYRGMYVTNGAATVAISMTYQQ